MKEEREAFLGPSNTVPSRKCFGLVTRKLRWGLSKRGWTLVLLTFGMGGLTFVLLIHPFLAVTERTEADVLVVEGWIDGYAIAAAADEFRLGSYRRVFTTGGPTPGLREYVNEWQTYASVGAESLRKAGLPADVVQMVPSRVAGRDRTYSSAVALRKRLRENGRPVAKLNVITKDVHARRTRLLFQKAFTSESEVGIISIPNPEYEPTRWWRYSRGVRDVLGEVIAYLYARLFFWPDSAGADA